MQISFWKWKYSHTNPYKHTFSRLPCSDTHITNNYKDTYILSRVAIRVIMRNTSILCILSARVLIINTRKRFCFLPFFILRSVMRFLSFYHSRFDCANGENWSCYCCCCVEQSVCYRCHFVEWRSVLLLSIYLFTEFRTKCSMSDSVCSCFKPLSKFTAYVNMHGALA